MYGILIENICPYFRPVLPDMCTCRPSSTRENLWAPVTWPAPAAPHLRSTLPVEEVRGPVRAVYIHDDNSKHILN